jgi:hypothetical protein
MWGTAAPQCLQASPSPNNRYPHAGHLRIRRYRVPNRRAERGFARCDIRHVTSTACDRRFRARVHSRFRMRLRASSRCHFGWWARQPSLRFVEVGGSGVGPVADVVGVAPAGGSVAVGFGAVFVAGDERFPELVGDGSGGAADVDDLAGSVGDDAADLAVRRQPPQGFLGEAADVFGFGPDLAEQVVVAAGAGLEVDDDAEVGAAPAPFDGPAVIMRQMTGCRSRRGLRLV